MSVVQNRVNIEAVHTVCFLLAEKTVKLKKKEQTILSPLGRGTVEDDALPLRMG